MRNKVNIGTASIILIFIILCLSVFSLLSLSDAKSAEVFAKRRADSVTAYYQADTAGQTFIRSVTESLRDGLTAFDAVKKEGGNLPVGASAEALADEQLIRCDIPMTAGQSLRVELNDRDASVLSYYVYNSEDYAIDSRLPVWTGSGE